MGNAREAWDRIGASRALLKELRFDIDTDLERRILACAVQDHRFWRIHGDLLQPEFFHEKTISIVFHLLHEYAASYGSPPDSVVARDLARQLPHLSQSESAALLSLLDVAYTRPVSGIDYVAQRVQELGRKRAIRAAVVRIADLNERVLASQDEDTTEEIAAVMAAALALGAKDPNPVYSIRRDYHMVPQWQAQFATGSVRTMIGPLDDALQGGLMVGELGVVLAPPHRGKTLTLVNLAAGALVDGSDTLYVTTEDGVRGIGPRLAANLSGTPREEFSRDWPTFLRELGKLLAILHADARIVYRPPRKTGVVEIRALLDRLASEEGFRPKLLILDYADRLKAPRRRKDRWDELIDLYMDLRALAEEKQVAIWTASQTGKGGWGKEVVDMDDFSGAFQKAGEADVVVAFSQTNQEKVAGEARLHLCKARNRGSGRMIHVFADPARSLLREVPLTQVPSLVGTQARTAAPPGQKRPVVIANNATGSPLNQPIPTPGGTP